MSLSYENVHKILIEEEQAIQSRNWVSTFGWKPMPEEWSPEDEDIVI